MADLALVALTLAWGTTFYFVKQALAGTSPGVFLALRFGAATLALLAAWLWRRERGGEHLLRHGVVLGLAMCGAFLLQTVGLHHTTPARSGFITGLSVLVVPFLARFLHGRPVRASAWIGVAFAVAGLAVMTRPFGEAVPPGVRFGDALTVGCALCYALQVVLTSEWSPRHPLLALTLVQVATTLAGTALLAALEPVRLDPGPTLVGVVLYTGLLFTAGAFFVMNWAQRRTTAVRAALIYALEPPAAAAFSHAMGAETLGPVDWAGGALIAFGVVAGEAGAAWAARRASGGRASSPSGS